MKPNTLTLSILASVITLALAAPPADAGGRTHSGGYKTGHGRTGTYHSQVQRSRGSVTRQGSITTERGHTYSRSSSSTYDRDSGAVNRSITGLRGQTRSAMGTYNKDTHTYDRTITGTKGSVHATTTYDKANRAATTTYTGSNGKTATSTTTYNPETKGRDTTLIGANGQSSTRSTSNAYDPDAGTLTHSVTGLRGNTRSVELTPDKP